MDFVSGLSRQKKTGANVPLHSWGIAHPLLQKQVNIAEDLKKIDALKKQFSWQVDLPFRDYLAENYSIIITNLEREIIWISHNFVKLTGYSEEELIGSRPMMLQGEKTDEKSRNKIRENLQKFESLKAKVINYRKNGELYNCNIEIFPLMNDTGSFTHFLALEKEVC